ncbi:site-specific DNA-methyltransferase [Aquiflexum sp. TKW24L]|uniref:site-specific DNA-methyltransferase n=1 Tax=Aquiflexum sp. TKW24L TaxID=2942212 RepID=UPI0020BDCDE0|nr:site-specific DNA-methyltransferase [Aquiflexum sp. TKW24L]MCL6259541.1 site-specific DNA-methyltransferase [Aquiflexum sp. TKW24L]
MGKSDYSNLSKDQLLEMIHHLDRSRKYGLVWEEEKDQEKVVAQCVAKTPILEEIQDREIINDKNQPTHFLIEGDNFHSLTVLHQTHQGKIDLIYIDPPYNTGKENEFLYNDRYVDISDGYRHSKWLSFMWKRLDLAKGLLKSTGAIFISIDDNEIAQLKLLCQEIFGEENFVAQFVRKNKAGSGHDSGQVAVEFDYMLCFAKNKAELKFAKEKLDVESDKKYRLSDSQVDHRGKYYLRDLDYRGSYSESMDYVVTAPDGTEMLSGGRFGKPNTWRWNQDKLKWGIENDFIVFKKTNKQWKVYIKQYQFVDNLNRRRERQLPYRALIQFLNSEGSQELNEVVSQSIFKFPKPIGLIRFCIDLFQSKDITVLDFFAGSGTTGHAVLKANEADHGKRQFILCTNNENNICEEVTYTRVSKVIKGYQGPKKLHPPIAQNLKYFKTAFEEKNPKSENKDNLIFSSK